MNFQEYSNKGNMDNLVEQVDRWKMESNYVKFGALVRRMKI